MAIVPVVVQQEKGHVAYLRHLLILEPPPLSFAAAAPYLPRKRENLQSLSERWVELNPEVQEVFENVQPRRQNGVKASIICAVPTCWVANALLSTLASLRFVLGKLYKWARFIFAKIILFTVSF